MATPPNKAMLAKLLGEMSYGPNNATLQTASVGVLQGIDSDLTTTGVIEHENAAGSYVKGYNTVVKNVAAGVGLHIAANVVDSGDIFIPRNGILTNLSWVVTANLGYESGTVTVKAGTSAGGEQFVTGNVGNVAGAATALVRGKGISTDLKFSKALGAVEPETPFVVDSLNYDSAAALHMQLSASGGQLTTGSVAFIAEFYYMGDDL